MLENNIKKFVIDLLIESNHLVNKISVVKLESNKDIVTKTDIEVSNMLINKLMNSNYKVRIETEESGIIQNDTNEEYYIAIDDIDGTDNYFRGNGLLPHCTCICVFEKSSEREKYLFSDIIIGACIEHSTQTIWIAEKNNGLKVLDINLKEKQFNIPQKRDVIDRKSVIITDIYGGKPKRLINLMDKVWFKDFGSSAFHYCICGSELFDGLIFETYKAHELGLGYIFAKESNQWISDWNLEGYDNKEYVFNGAYEVLITCSKDAAKRILELM